MEPTSANPEMRRLVTDDVPRGLLIASGVVIVVLGSLASWFYLDEAWRATGASASVALGLLLAVFGRPSSFWLEGDVVCWGNQRSATRLAVRDASEIRTVFVPKAPRSLRLANADVVIEIPINTTTEPLRREIGLLFREVWPTRVLSDQSAMAALLLDATKP